MPSGSCRRLCWKAALHAAALALIQINNRSPITLGTSNSNKSIFTASANLCQPSGTHAESLGCVRRPAQGGAGGRVMRRRCPLRRQRPVLLFEACSAFTRVAARTLAPSPIRDLLHRRLQPFCHLHDCSGCFRLERLPGGACTHWKAPPSTAHANAPWHSPNDVVSRSNRPEVGLSACSGLATCI